MHRGNKYLIQPDVDDKKLLKSNVGLSWTVNTHVHIRIFELEMKQDIGGKMIWLKTAQGIIDQLVFYVIANTTNLGWTQS